MSDILEGLKEYLVNTAKDQVKKDWEEFAQYDNIEGPSAEEYIRLVKFLNHEQKPQNHTKR